MKLWRGGFGDFMTYTVAEDLHDAIENIQDKLNMKALPVIAETVDNIDGYTIVALSDEDKSHIEKCISESEKASNEYDKLVEDNEKLRESLNNAKTLLEEKQKNAKK